MRERHCVTPKFSYFPLNKILYNSVKVSTLSNHVNHMLCDCVYFYFSFLVASYFSIALLVCELNLELFKQQQWFDPFVGDDRFKVYISDKEIENLNFHCIFI